MGLEPNLAADALFELRRRRWLLASGFAVGAAPMAFLGFLSVAYFWNGREAPSYTDYLGTVLLVGGVGGAFGLAVGLTWVVLSFALRRRQRPRRPARPSASW
jgi:hypothetical protein